MSIADSYGYPAAQHINVIVAQHKANAGNIYPVSGDHSSRARAHAARLPNPLRPIRRPCDCIKLYGLHSNHCASLDSEGKTVAR